MVTHHRKKKKKSTGSTQFLHKFFTISAIGLVSFILIGAGVLLFWIATLKLPALDAFDERKVSESTKIYDRTGEVVLYDIHENIQRTLVSGDEISIHAKNAIVAIEDDQFYQHKGVDVRATFRAVLYTLLSKVGLRNGNTQGGSTLTQQVVKNTLLTSEKQISRKLKEWFLSVRLEQKLSKDEILTHYLNVAPYGGTIYGIEEASQAFFAKTAADLTVAESAYLAALPNAPTFYSPYGQNIERLENRKNLVLRKMFDLGFISEDIYNQARNEEVVFRPQQENSAKALHFVQYVRSYLEQRYGRDVIENGGLKIITTLDYELQQKAEDTVAQNALINEENWGATNQGVIVIDPKTGHILTMVGSRDYFDTENEGNFNVTLAKRQPGSAFKPFIYLTAMEEGYTDETIVFDVRTQFSSTCDPLDMTSEDECYSPQNYDGEFEGPITLRNALAQSRNVPAVKTLYLAGLEDSLRTAKDMGITTLDRNANRYGLTLVLGGGEVSLLDMTSAYGVFATGGMRTDPVAIMKIEDKNGDILEEHTPRPRQVVDQNAVAIVNSILSDNEARTPLFGARSFMYFGESYDVAAKTGTTNNNKDAWLVGYSPNAVVGVWTGNNDNTPMTRGSSISGSTWRSVMDEVLRSLPREYFAEPVPEQNYSSLKPILRGIWQGGDAIAIDTISGNLATEYTPIQTLDYLVTGTPHSILHWVNKNNPRGAIPSNPDNDNQYEQWEPVVQNWIDEYGSEFLIQSENDIPTDFDDVHTPENTPEIIDINPNNNSVHEINELITVSIQTDSEFDISDIKFFLNGHYIGVTQNNNFSFTPDETGVATTGDNTLLITVTDEVYNQTQEEYTLVFN